MATRALDELLGGRASGAGAQRRFSRERCGVPRLAISLATILLTGSAALPGELSPADASAPSQETQGPPPTVSASGGSVSSSAPFPILPALPSDYFATTPHLLGEWPDLRSRLNDLGITVSLTGVDEAVLNLSGGERRIAQEAGQVALQAEFDLQKSLGLQGARFLVTLVDRWGRDAATDAGIPALQLLNEVYGRGNILRLEQFAWDQKWFDGRVETTAGRLAFGDEFFSYPCDFINLTFCPGQAGNLVGDYIYNWPVSQWAAVAKVNFGSEGYFKAGVFEFEHGLSQHEAQPRPLANLPRRVRKAPFFPPKSPGRPNSTASREATSLEVGGAAMRRRMSRPASMESRSWCQDCPGFPVTDATVFPPCCSSNSRVSPRTRTRRTTGSTSFSSPLMQIGARPQRTTRSSVGLVQYGLGPWRPRDAYGIAVGTTHVNPNIANGQILANALGVGPGFVQHNEYVTEAWYGWQTTPWLNLKLDAQYVICPGGYTAPTNCNAFVLGVRTTVDFW